MCSGEKEERDDNLLMHRLACTLRHRGEREREEEENQGERNIQAVKFWKGAETGCVVMISKSHVPMCETRLINQKVFNKNTYGF